MVTENQCTLQDDFAHAWQYIEQQSTLEDMVELVDHPKEM
jgi:hypothetical protein